MNRRSFVKNITLTSSACMLAPIFSWGNSVDLIVGHGSHRYKVDLNWGVLNSTQYPVKDCHEMVQDKKGTIYLLTNHTANNVIIYNTSGKLIQTWGKEYPGAHGLSIKDEGGEEFLYITDTERHEVIKTTLKGRVVQVFEFPKDAEVYESPNQYMPTETTIADNGDVYVADGYGSQFILHYSAAGDLLNVFAGRGDGDTFLDNAHGITIDQRDSKNTRLLVTDRMKNQLKYYSLDGTYLSKIDLPGAYVCRPVIKGKFIYLATIWSGNGGSNSGYVSILDEENKLISAPGGGTPTYLNGELEPNQQALKLFKHPHDVCVDRDENLYVAQWNSGNTYPIKLIRV